VKGTRYFECGANCGVIVRPWRVEVGDFDVIDEFGSDEEF
jgi:tubulin-folding cofactor B